MRILTPIVNVALVLALIFSGLPLFSPEDANRDRRVNLEDAFLNVRELVRSAETPDTFVASMQKAVATLQLMAGLKTVIKAAGHTNHTSTPPTLDFPYLISTFSLYLPSYVDLAIIEDPLICKSLAIPPSPPPPRSSLFC